MGEGRTFLLQGSLGLAEGIDLRLLGRTVQEDGFQFLLNLVQLQQEQLVFLRLLAKFLLPIGSQFRLLVTGQG